MNQTKELLLRIRAAVIDGRLPAEAVPLADMEQCVRAELEVNRSTFTESQYVEVLERFGSLCALGADQNADKNAILMLTDALILCVDMISQAVYALADGNYWHYKHGQEAKKPEIAEIIEYIDKNHRIDLISYDFVKEYNDLQVDIQFDEICKMRYVPYKGRRMYFPKAWNEEKIRSYYRSVTMEQDLRSPHCYHSERCGVKSGDVVVDAGAAEGIFALDCIDCAKKVYLIEADPDWIEALRQTFRNDGDKVRLIVGFLDSFQKEGHVSIDGLFGEEEINYIKMDIEGAEKAALEGAARTLENGKNISCAICSYHCRGDEKRIRDFLESKGFVTDTSKGYMCPDWTLEAYLEAEVRRGIVFGRKEEE